MTTKYTPASKDIDGNAVEVGDRLTCIDASASFHRLNAGGVYTAEAAYNGEPTVNINGAYHSIDRFRAGGRMTKRTKHTHATPLRIEGFSRNASDLADYLTHAANAYPQLVEEVRGLRDYCRAAVRRVRGKADKAHYGARADLADTILRSLGEDA